MSLGRAHCGIKFLGAKLKPGHLEYTFLPVLRIIIHPIFLECNVSSSFPTLFLGGFSMVLPTIVKHSSRLLLCFLWLSVQLPEAQSFDIDLYMPLSVPKIVC